MALERREEVLAKIAGSGDLPTLPEVALRVTQLVDDPNSGVSDIVNVIRNDPSLTSKILKIANSAFYGMRRRIESLNMALVILGMREISSLVTAVSVFKAFPQNNLGVRFDYSQFWLHSAGVGEVAKFIGGRLGYRDISSIFTAGLLHDIGKIVEAQYFPDEFLQCLSIASEENISLREAESQVLGTDHCEIGALLAKEWGLPNFLVDVIQMHHDVQSTTAHKQEIALIHIADAFCKSTHYGFGGDKTGVAVKDDPIWEVLFTQKSDLHPINIEQFSSEIETQINHAREFLAMTV